jgi:hypothetical protein
VDPAQVCEGLEEALALVEESQESPEALFGTAEEHADALYDRWVAEGRLHLWDASRMTWAEVPAWGLGIAAFWSLGFMLYFLVHGETSRVWTLGMIVIPVGVGLAKAATWAAWDSLLRSRGTAAAVVGAVATLTGLSLLIASVNEWSKAHPFGTASTWWYVWVSAACALAAAAWGRWADARPAPAPPGIMDVDEWSRQLAAILRGRYGLADVRVRTIVGDAHAHAADAGRSVQDEFGTPEDYAARFEPDRARGHRLEAALWAVLGIAQGILLIDDFGWVRAIVAASCIYLAVRHYRRQD